MPRRARAGLTVTELLTTVGIIVLLVTLLTPALWGALGYARKATCAARLHTLYMALMTYAADYNERLPLVHFFDPSRFEEPPLPDGTPVPPVVVVPPYDFPPPPGWWNLRYALRDYVSDEEVFFCPTHPEPLLCYRHLPRQFWMSYMENQCFSGIRLREIPWPLHEAALLGCPRFDAHFGRIHHLRADGSVVASRVAATYHWRKPWHEFHRAVLGLD